MFGHCGYSVSSWIAASREKNLTMLPVLLVKNRSLDIYGNIDEAMENLATDGDAT